MLRPEATGRTVLDHLSSRHGHSSREEWQARIEEGRVQVDGQPAGPETRLRQAQVLVWHRPPWVEPEAPRCFAVLHRDSDVLAAAKPSGLPTLPGAGFLESTLLHLVRRLEPGATPVHRLGRATSGIVIFARTARARSALTESFRSRQVTKIYRALVQGQPREDRFSVDVPIGPVPHPLLGTVHAACSDGVLAHSEVHVIRRDPTCSLVEVSITTGRPHQIRIHLAAAGHPLSGDPLYGIGGVPLPAPSPPGAPGYRLHARRLALPHPSGAGRLELCCADPPDLRDVGVRCC
jgi:23S rRNA pseudouridine1911/1915/1917 synthase